jgi:hypothetical protein
MERSFEDEATGDMGQYRRIFGPASNFQKRFFVIE